MPENMLYIVGQVLSIVPVVLGFVTFQMKTAGRVLALQIVTALLFALHFFLIGVLSGAGLNLLATVQCVCYYFRDKRGNKSLVLPIIFATLFLATGILTWDGWYCIFVVVGLVINAMALALSDAQKIRYAMFIKSPCCLIYNVFAFSLGGIIYECVAIISAVIGTARHYLAKKRGTEYGEV